MLIRRPSISAFTQWLLFFIFFGGYYAALTVVAEFIGNDASRLLTIPIRALTLLLVIMLFLQHPRLKLKYGVFYALIFSLIYIARISIEMLHPEKSYHIPTIEFLLYFLSFFVIPLLGVSQTKFVEADYQRTLHGILFGCFMLAFFSTFFYGSLIGEVTRITSSAKGTSDYTSPLALSYVSTLGFVVALLYVTNNNVRGWVRHYILAGAVLCLVPFFLGASRGAIFAGAGAFLFYLAFATNVKKRLVGFFLVLLTTVTLIFAQNFLGTGVFDRLLSLQQDIESGSASVIRLKIWTDGLHQFLRNPLFGNSLESEYVNFHPHNILIEILISTGLLGFISFILFIVYVFAKSIRITRQAPQYYWIVGIFIVGFIQNQFSGAIYSASWVAMGAALVLGFTLPAKEATVSVVKS